METAVRAEFTRIALITLKKETGNRKQGFDDLFLNQINRHLDIHWVFSPLDEENYQTSYKAAEALLGSVKNVRPFEQFGTSESLGEAGRKCSLDGENNALFFGKGTNKRFFDYKWNPFAIELNISSIKVQENEGLSAVSLTKRFFDIKGTNKGFDSTTEIALLNSLKKLKGHNALEQFQKVFHREKIIEICQEEGGLKMNGSDWQSFDEQFYYEENLVEKYIPCKSQLKIAQKRHRDLQKAFKDNQVKFDKYYALIMFDGDKMGEKLSEASSKEEHKKFSKLLTTFASKAREILKDKGQTVYTGGDDFLGFVNLHYLFEVMTELRNQFKTLVSDKAKNILNISDEFTFSAGIVIAQYKMPLAEVLKTVRKVEKKAKNDGGRNAFCISAMKHSGEIQETVLKWGDDNMNWKALEYITQQLGDGVFSNKFITNLTVELYQLAGFTLNDIGVVSFDAIFTEFDRLLKRGLIKRVNKEVNEKEILKMTKKLIELFLSSDDVKQKRIENFIHALQIADFLSRKTS